MNKRELCAALTASEQAVGLVRTLHHYFGSNFRVRIAFSPRVCGMIIEDLQLSVRSMNALKRQRIDTIDQLIDAISNDELIRIRNLGKKSISEIKTVVLDLGFRQLSEEEKRSFFEQMVDLNPEIVRKMEGCV